jgi:putative membrane protein
MHVLALSLIALVAVEHLYFMYLEMFAWTKPRTRRAFGTTAEFAEASKSLAANQGLYNGFLAAGLIWSLLRSLIEYVDIRNTMRPIAVFATELQVFFLACVIVAALYGGITVKRSILVIQGLPATLALAVVLLS